MEKKDFYLRVALVGAIVGASGVVVYEQTHGVSGNRANATDQEPVKPAEIGNFDVGDKKVKVTRFDEVADKNNPGWKTVLIFGEASADLSSEVASGGWTFDLGTRDGQFPATVIVTPDLGSTSKKGSTDTAYPYGVVITTSIHSDINAYSLEITHDLGTIQDGNGGIGGSSSFSLPIRREDLSPNRV